jgi:uncharacterized protein (TIGR00106 family)
MLRFKLQTHIKKIQIQTCAVKLNIVTVFPTDRYRFRFITVYNVSVCDDKTNLNKEKLSMQVIVDLCVVPLGVGTSVSKYVAKCQKILLDAGLKINLHAYGTNIEGEFDQVFAAIKRCHEEIHEAGAPRISTTIKLGSRIDRKQTMVDKINSVEEKLK